MSQDQERLARLDAECLEFIREQSAGEWGDKVEREDAGKLFGFVLSKITQAQRIGWTPCL